MSTGSTAEALEAVQAAKEEVYAIAAGSRRGREQEALAKIARALAVADVQVQAVLCEFQSVTRRADAELQALQAGDRRWTMRVPVERDRDSDTVIHAALEAVEAILKAGAEAA